MQYKCLMCIQAGKACLLGQTWLVFHEPVITQGGFPFTLFVEFCGGIKVLSLDSVTVWYFALYIHLISEFGLWKTFGDAKKDMKGIEWFKFSPTVRL